MSRFMRLSVATVLGAAGLVLTAPPVSAQFGAGYRGFGPSGSVNPIGIAIPRIGAMQALNGRLGTNFGPNIGWSQYYWNQSYNPRGASWMYPTVSSSGYMTGGVRNAAVDAYKRDYALAQQQAGVMSSVGARGTITGVWGYEQGRQTGGPPAAPAPVVATESDIASGEALTAAVAGIAAAEKKGARAESGFLPPDLLGSVRYAGSPAADALNLARRAGQLELPAVFGTTDALREARAVLEPELTAVAAAVQAGRQPDPASVARLVAAAKQADAALAPAIAGDLSFDDASAARHLLNEIAALVKVVRDPAFAGLVNPKWAAQGTSAAEFARRMTKFKLRFGPVNRGDEDAYFTLYQVLADYRTALELKLNKKK